MVCDGFEDFDTWDILYDFPNGVKNDGTRYKGTRRRAFLPNTDKGKEILALLVLAFERKLTFIVGTSVTTGQKNVVVWSGIHHKTNLSGGTSNFGYPDETYFNRVTLELADRGVILEDKEVVNKIINNSVGHRLIYD